MTIQPDDILSALELTPDQVPGLPGGERTRLISFLLRWDHNVAAQRCLQQLLVTDSHRVTIYDALARAHLAQGESKRALELMARRHALGISNSSRALEARAHLEAGDLAAAQIASDALVDEQPDLLITWDLRAEVCLASGDMDGAEDAYRQYEERRRRRQRHALQFAKAVHPLHAIGIAEQRNESDCDWKQGHQLLKCESR